MMKRMMLLGCALVMAVVGCDTEEDETVGEFTSSLSAETVKVQEMTFPQMTTLCEEEQAYGLAKKAEAEAAIASCPVPDLGDGVEMEVSSEAGEAAASAAPGCASADFKKCDATVEELLPCITASAEAKQAIVYSLYALSCPDAATAAAGITAGADCADVHSRCPDFFPLEALTAAAGEVHEGEEHAHEGEDHEGEDHEGEDHEGEDHEGEDHEGEDHEGEEGEM